MFVATTSNTHCFHNDGLGHIIVANRLPKVIGVVSLSKTIDNPHTHITLCFFGEDPNTPQDHISFWSRDLRNAWVSGNHNLPIGGGCSKTTENVQQTIVVGTTQPNTNGAHMF